IREANLPRMGARGVHRVEMLCRTFSALTSREESDPGNCSGHCTLQAANRPVSDLFDTGLSRIIFSRNHHARLEDHTFQINSLQEKRGKGDFESLLRYLLAALNRMGAIEQDFRFDDGHYPALLAKRRVARQCVGVGFETGIGRYIFADSYHGTPFGK